MWDYGLVFVVGWAQSSAGQCVQLCMLLSLLEIVNDLSSHISSSRSTSACVVTYIKIKKKDFYHSQTHFKMDSHWLDSHVFHQIKKKTVQ